MRLRQKIALISLVNTGILLWLSNYQGSVQAALLVAFIFFIGAFWIVKFDVLPIGFTVVLGFPSVIVFIWSLFYFVTPFSGFIKFVFVLIFYVLNYVLFLNANIINVSTIRKIALVQLSQTISLILVLATLALLVLLLEITKLGPLIFFASLGLFIFYLSLNLLLINYIDLKNAVLLSILNTACMLFLLVAASMFGISFNVFASIICLVTYALFSYEFDRKMKLFNYLEAPFIFILIILMIFTSII